MKALVLASMLSPVFASILCTAAAHATESAAPRAPAAAKHLEFDDDAVIGDLVRAEGDGVSSVGRARHEILIRVRTTFVPELLHSADNL